MTIDSCLNEAREIIIANTIIVSVALIIIGALLILFRLRKDKSSIKYAVILLILVLAIYSYNTVPLAIDYCNKDIVIDTGSYYFREGQGIFAGDDIVYGSMDVELDNNGHMVLTNANGYPSGKNYGKIAFGKHSKKILGFEDLNQKVWNGSES